MSKSRHYSEQEFEALVSSALDELPVEFQRALEHVAIVVSDRGAENHAYGMYVGSRLGGSPYFGGGGLARRDPDLSRHARARLRGRSQAPPGTRRPDGASRGWSPPRLRRGRRSQTRALMPSRPAASRPAWPRKPRRSPAHMVAVMERLLVRFRRAIGFDPCTARSPATSAAPFSSSSLFFVIWLAIGVPVGRSSRPSAHPSVDTGLQLGHRPTTAGPRSSSAW